MSKINNRLLIGVAGEDLQIGDLIVMVIDDDGTKIYKAKESDLDMKTNE